MFKLALVGSVLTFASAKNNLDGHPVH